MKICPKCKCKWPDNIEYCVCGQKLQEEGFYDILNDLGLGKYVDDFKKNGKP